MIVIGLTGSVGMGKTTTAQVFARAGVPVFDADRAVHALLAHDHETIAAVRAAFPRAAGDAGIDRHRLGRAVFADARKVRRLEAILHPRVRRAQVRWLARQRMRRARRVLLDIPLLFETGGDALCDITVVATAPEPIQRQRVLARPGMTPAKLAGILANQMPDAEKRRRADYLVLTGLGRRFARDQVIRLLAAIQGDARCAKSSSTRKPPGSIPGRATAWSRSAASS